ncbi:MAG TPA: family 16 glycoside hydrolase [Ktedonobacteraceae bacterium]
MNFDVLIRAWKGEDYRSGQIMTNWRRQALAAFLVVYLIVSLIACSTGAASQKASASPPAPVHPTPTTLPKGTMLYQSDWSHGLGDWRGSAGWKLSQGFLQSDLSNNNFITTPYMPTVPNYAIEVRFQIVSVPRNGGSFVIIADKAQGKDGYTAGILGLLGPGPHSQFANPEVQVYLDPTGDMDSPLVVSDYEPGSAWHTYRVEVKGPEVDFFIDGLMKSSAYSSQTDFLSNGPIRLRTAMAIVRVSSVRITAL